MCSTKHKNPEESVTNNCNNTRSEQLSKYRDGLITLESWFSCPNFSDTISII